jgi:hypothetical protein|uniref:Uncharacterized protein n=1 Tax=Bionectria ochroleuca TaxID=29856 RepID=A0A8H7KFF8_BIOOC
MHTDQDQDNRRIMGCHTLDRRTHMLVGRIRGDSKGRLIKFSPSKVCRQTGEVSSAPEGVYFKGCDGNYMIPNLFLIVSPYRANTGRTGGVFGYRTGHGLWWHGFHLMCISLFLVFHVFLGNE